MRSQKPEARSQNEEPEAPRARRARSFYWLLAPGFWLLFSAPGCAPSAAVREADRAVAEYVHGDFHSARMRLDPLAREPNENFVLNNVRLGSAALVDYDLDAAE